MISFPNAKVNLGLRILGKREDGFHDLSSLFLPISLCDILEMLPAKEVTTLHCSGLPLEGRAEDNLCLRAHALMVERYGIPPVTCYLHKQIPTGAGLGGGSSNAAFSLKLLNEMFDLGLSQKDLFGLAMELGSDCGFFILNHPAWVEGRGERVKAVEWEHACFHIVLLKPPFSISTAEAYRQSGSTGRNAFDGLPGPESWRDYFSNDFENYARKEFPVIGSLISSLYHAGAVYAGLSGSGSAVFGLFRHSIPALPYPPGIWQVATSILI